MSTVDTWIGPIQRADYESWKFVLLYLQPLKELYEDPELTEIMVDRYDRVSVERKGRIELVDYAFPSEEALQGLITQVGHALDQHVGDENPILNARLPDASRLCCTFPRVTPQGATITLRKAPSKLFTFSDLLAFGSLSQEMFDYIAEKVGDAANMLVSGNTGSGKTTVLRACFPLIPAGERVVLAEDTAELNVPAAVAMEAPKRRLRPGEAPVTFEMLIETMLRQRPDRPWVGEIRSAEAAAAFLQLINTGHSGTATTLHANSCEDAIRRIQFLLASSGKLGFELAGHQVRGSVQLLIHCDRSYRFGRRITQIATIDGDRVIPVFRFDANAMKHVRAN